MNGELIDMLAPVCRGSTAFLAIGNVDRGDDGAGVALGRNCARRACPSCSKAAWSQSGYCLGYATLGARR